MPRPTLALRAAILSGLVLCGCRSAGSDPDGLVRLFLAAADERLLAIRRVVVVAGPPPDPGRAAAIASWIEATPERERRSLEASEVLATQLRQRGIRDLLQLEENRALAGPIEVVGLVSWPERGGASSLAAVSSADTLVWVAAGRLDALDGARIELRRATWCEPAGQVFTDVRTVTFPALGAPLAPGEREALRRGFQELLDEARAAGMESGGPLIRTLERAFLAAGREGGPRPEEREEIIAGLLLIDLRRPARDQP